MLLAAAGPLPVEASPPQEGFEVHVKADIVLYNVPPSFYSQVARLALAEKGLSWEDRIVAPGPPILETYRPWYMRLNPGGTVPTLLHNGEVVSDSMLIAEYVDRNFDGPCLVPHDPEARAGMQRWIDAYRSIPVRELTYGKIKVRKVGAFVNRLRIRRLQKLAARHPDMAPVYRAKEADIRGFSEHAADDAHMEALRRHVTGLLNELDAALADREWIAGDGYSLADVVWTVTVGRLRTMGDIAPLAGRPALSRWFEAAKRRPSFEAADVWDRVKPGKIAKMILGKLWPQLSAVLLVGSGLCVAVLWLAA